MGQIRNALRAYALKGAGPGEVIDDLHALVAASAGAITFVTVVYVVLDPRTGAGELASAGHLPRADRRAAATSTRRAARRSGSAAPPPCTLGRFTLAPGETLWLYTDGLSSRAGAPIDDGLALLAERRPRRDRQPMRARSPTSCWSSCPPRATTTSRCSGCAGCGQ